jgi:hypothetical protein
MIQEYINEQEGEPVIDDSRFQIDSIWTPRLIDEGSSVKLLWPESCILKSYISRPDPITLLFQPRSTRRNSQERAHEERLWTFQFVLRVLRALPFVTFVVTSFSVNWQPATENCFWPWSLYPQPCSLFLWPPVF